MSDDPLEGSVEAEEEEPLSEADSPQIGESLTSELEHRMRLMHMIERMTATVMESLEGENAIKPKKFNELTAALAAAGRIMEMQMKAIEGLRESEERLEQKLIRAVVGLSEYLQLSQKQCKLLAQVRLSGVIPQAGEVPRPVVGNDALLRREGNTQRPEAVPETAPEAEHVPEVQAMRQALDQYDAIPEPRNPLQPLGPEKALPRKRKMNLSDAERQRRREQGLKLAQLGRDRRARKKAEREAAAQEETP